MKKISILMLSMITISAQAQSLLGSLTQHQNSIQTPGASSGSSGNSTPGSDVSSSGNISSSSGGRCEENDQTSLPLSYITSLIQAKNAKLDISFDPRSESLSVSAPDMISNCSSMIEWTLKDQEIAGRKVYAVEATLKQGSDCVDGVCTYKIAKVENGSFVAHQEMKFKPTLKGFEECLQQSGVIKDNKVVAGAIYSAPMMEKFKGVKDSGKLLFVSHGPSSALVKAKYGKFELINKCDHYESIHPEVKELLSLEDEERMRLNAEASKLKDCPINEYYRVADFIEKYEDYASELGQVRDRLILEAAKKSAIAIQSGKYTDEDLKVISDFEKYLVLPKIELARAIYNEMIDLEGSAKVAKQEHLKSVLAEIKALNEKPYFLGSHTQKLINDGKFEDAERLNSLKIFLHHHTKLGSKVDNVVITPEIAMNKITKEKTQFIADLEKEKERYDVRTGQTTGQAAYFNGLASRMRRNIQVRTQNFNQEIQLEFGRVQQGGYCYAYFRNTQKCIQDSVDRIKELQNLLAHYNKIDTERAAEYDGKAKEYEKLEAEGRRYIAAQNGEEAPVESEARVPEDTTVPTPRSENSAHSGVYNFNYPGAQQNGQPQQPMPGQPFLPGQQQPYYGQPSPVNSQHNPFQQWAQYNGGGQYSQSSMYGYSNQNAGMGANGAYSFNWGGGQPQSSFYGQQQQPWYGQQQQQPGYWGQPHQAYNMYSMYGR